MTTIQSLPKDFQSYTLVKMLKPAKSGKTASVGIYTAPDGMKVVIKRLLYTRKNSAYRKIMNETTVMRIFEGFNSKLRYPQLYEVVINYRELFVVREYIKGMPIRNTAPALVEKTIRTVLSELNRMNHEVDPQSLKGLSKRSPIQIMVSLPCYFIVSVLRNSSLLKRYGKLLKIFYANYARIKVFDATYALAHRDLTPDNILIYSDKISVIDTEVCMLAETESDLVVVAREFYSEIGFDRLMKLLREYVKTVDQKRNFLGLSAYYLLQSFATMDMHDEGYTRDIEYMKVFIDTIVPSL